MGIKSLARDFLEAVVVAKYILFRVCQNIPSECTDILPLRAMGITWKNVCVLLWSFDGGKSRGHHGLCVLRL